MIFFLLRQNYVPSCVGISNNDIKVLEKIYGFNQRRRRARMKQKNEKQMENLMGANLALKKYELDEARVGTNLGLNCENREDMRKEQRNRERDEKFRNSLFTKNIILSYNSIPLLMPFSPYN